MRSISWRCVLLSGALIYSVSTQAAEPLNTIPFECSAISKCLVECHSANGDLVKTIQSEEVTLEVYPEGLSLIRFKGSHGKNQTIISRSDSILCSVSNHK